MTCDLSVARKWFHMGVGLTVLSPSARIFLISPASATGMQKIKKQRTADCVVGGFRYLERKKLIGSLLLGLYNDEVCSTRRLYFLHS